MIEFIIIFSITTNKHSNNTRGYRLNSLVLPAMINNMLRFAHFSNEGVSDKLCIAVVKKLTKIVTPITQSMHSASYAVTTCSMVT